jgi:hypothetical protein
MISFDQIDEIEGKTPKKNSPQVAAERRSDRGVLRNQQLSVLQFLQEVGSQPRRLSLVVRYRFDKLETCWS